MGIVWGRRKFESSSYLGLNKASLDESRALGLRELSTIASCAPPRRSSSSANEGHTSARSCAQRAFNEHSKAASLGALVGSRIPCAKHRLGHIYSAHPHACARVHQSLLPPQLFCKFAPRARESDSLSFFKVCSKGRKIFPMPNFCVWLGEVSTSDLAVLCPIICELLWNRRRRF